MVRRQFLQVLPLQASNYTIILGGSDVYSRQAAASSVTQHAQHTCTLYYALKFNYPEGTVDHVVLLRHCCICACVCACVCVCVCVYVCMCVCVCVCEYNFNITYNVHVHVHVLKLTGTYLYNYDGNWRYVIQRS